jgi:TonB family protein
MKEFAIYSLHANALLIVSYLFYRLLLSNESSFKANRIYLIVSACLSVLIPLVNMPSFFKSLLVEIHLSEVVVYNIGSAISTSVFSYSNLLTIIYIAGAGIALLIFLKNILQIFSLILKGKVHKKEGYTEVESQKTDGIFSFLNFLVIPSNRPYGETEILEHELTHIRQFHSLDVLFFELLSVVFWYNPICYLFKASIKENHEFLADEAAVKQKNNPTEYSKLIVNYALDVDYPLLSGNFMNHSFLKRRIIMLSKQPSGTNYSRLKYGLTTLLLIATLVLTSFLKENNILVNTGKGHVVEHPDVMPKYAGEGGLGKFLQENIRYPQNAKEKNITGTVYINFIINEEGDVVNAHVLKGTDKELDAEALRVINLMPAWTPAKSAGKPVSVSYNIPIHFELH